MPYVDLRRRTPPHLFIARGSLRPSSEEELLCLSASSRPYYPVSGDRGKSRLAGTADSPRPRTRNLYVFLFRLQGAPDKRRRSARHLPRVRGTPIVVLDTAA